MRRHAAVLAAVASVVLAGCGGPAAQESSIPKITLSGTPDAQTSLAPDEVLGARKAAGIEACPKATTVPADHPSDGLPSLVLDCLGGDSLVNLAALPTGKPYVVNVWAQWCWPCTQEAPFLGEVWKQAKARGTVGFIGINYADPATGKAIDFAKKYGMTYPELHDPKSKVKIPLRVANVPRTVFVDAQGHVVHQEPDYFHSADQLRQEIKQYLGVEL